MQYLTFYRYVYYIHYLCKLQCTSSSTVTNVRTDFIAHSDSSESAVHDGALRLVDGLREHEGRVEVYHFGLWGTVDIYQWDLLDAIVVCRQLNYSTAETTKQYRCNSSAPLWLSSVHCTGLENELTQCRNAAPTMRSPCSHHRDAGVVCSG